MTGMTVDHLVVAAPDLDQGVSWVEDRLGAPVSPGGRHPRWGTRNVLLPLEGQAFIEVIAPDEGRPACSVPLFGIHRLAAPRLVTWAVRTTRLEEWASRARTAGVDPGPVLPGRRERPDGTVLTWRLTDPLAPRAHGVVPFLIDWEDTPHPSAGAPPVAALASLRLRHPEPVRLAPVFVALGLDVALGRADEPGLEAALHTPTGTAVLD